MNSPKVDVGSHVQQVMIAVTASTRHARLNSPLLLAADEICCCGDSSECTVAFSFG
jgi:hypothetical protein